LTGTVAWVAGGAGYLGGESARALADHGAPVVIADRALDRAEELAAELNQAGRSASAMMLDVSDSAASERQADENSATHGRLDVAVYLPSYYTGLTYDELHPEALQDAFNIHLTGPLVFSRSAARHMAVDGNGGRIILFSSMYGMVSPQPRNYPDG